MSNEEKNTPEQEQQEGLLSKVTHAVDSAIDSATGAVEQVVSTAGGNDSAVQEEAATDEATGTTATTEQASSAKSASPATPPAATAEKKDGRNERKTRDGIVVSNKMDKTISVQIERRLQHPIYGKYVKKSKKLIAHDETNQCQIGDLVRIMECRPLSRRKRWRLISVLEQAK